MIRRAVACALLCAATGCGSDDSGDSKACSKTADGDQDYLTDCEELALGTDPALADTDGDGYLDGDEVLEGKDPLDAQSRIYAGGWPYQRKKSDLADPGFSGQAAAGSRVPRLIATDQFGETVDLYDFALHDKPVAIDLSALWCDACKQMALWLEGKPSTYDANPEFHTVVERVQAGELLWVTVLFEDAYSNPATAANVKTWGETYPNAKVAVLRDDQRKLRDWFFPGAMPSVQPLNSSLELVLYERFDYKKPLAELAK